MRVKIIDKLIDVIDYAQVCDRLEGQIKLGQSGFVVAANVDVLIRAYFQPEYAAVLAQADLVVPDGMPLVWGMNLLGVKNQTRVYGPDLMLTMCDRCNQKGYGIYLYGSTSENLVVLAGKLTQKFPQLLISGMYAPPQFELKSGIPRFDHLAIDLERINRSGASLILVGLGCPKQEFWMAAAKANLTGIAIGVGAAFDFHSGRINQAPSWIMAIGLEWLYRLIQEPGRLWRRYLCQNPVFVVLFLIQLFKHKLLGKSYLV